MIESAHTASVPENGWGSGGGSGCGGGSSGAECADTAWARARRSAAAQVRGPCSMPLELYCLAVCFCGRGEPPPL